MTKTIIRRSGGFSLLELSIVLALLAGAAILLVPVKEQAPSFTEEATVLEVADRQLQYFIATNSRLPCPDQNGDGWEDCGAGAGAKGTLPLRNLGMNNASYGLKDMPLRYGVYRSADNGLVNGSDGGSAYYNDADLAVVMDRFEPVMSGGEWVQYDNAAAADFCVALESAQANAFDPQLTHVSDGTTTYNVAYAIASPGRYDSDGSGSLFDGLNGVAGQGFNSDNAALSGAYDDRVKSRTFAELELRLQCFELVQSLNLIANGRQTEIEVSDTLADNQSSTIVGSIINGVGLAGNVVDLIQAAIAVADAVAHLATASGLLAAAIASCFALVGCAAIPGYVAGVSAATVGLASATASVVAAAVATAGQVATTAMYITAAIQASITDLEFEAVDLSDAITELNGQLAQAQVEKVQLQVELTAATQKAELLKQTADDSLAAIEEYALDNRDPDAAGQPAVLAVTQQALAAVRAMNDAKAEYEAKEEALVSASTECAHQDPPDPDHPTCLRAANLQAERDAAMFAYVERVAEYEAARDAARDAGADFQVYQGTDGDGNKQFTACGALASCELDSRIWQSRIEEVDGQDVDLGSGLVAEYRDYHGQQVEVDFLTDSLARKEENIAEMETSIASLNCVQDGKQYNQETGVCSAADATEPASALRIGLGAEAILREVDGRPMVGEQ